MKFGDDGLVSARYRTNGGVPRPPPPPTAAVAVSFVLLIYFSLPQQHKIAHTHADKNGESQWSLSLSFSCRLAHEHCVRTGLCQAHAEGKKNANMFLLCLVSGSVPGNKLIQPDFDLVANQKYQIALTSLA